MASVGKCIIGVAAAAAVAAAFGTAAAGTASASSSTHVASTPVLGLNTATSTNTDGVLHGEDVIKKAAAALAAAPGVRIAGNGGDDNDAFDSEVHIDRIMLPGSATSDTVTCGDLTVSFLIVNGAGYIKAPGVYYYDNGSSEASAEALDNVWAKVPASQTKDFIEGMTLKSFTDEMKDPKQSPVLDKVTYENRLGHQRLVVTQKNGDKWYLDPATYLPVEYLSPLGGPNGPGDFDFLDYGISVPVSAPVGALTADLPDDSTNDTPATQTTLSA